MDVGRGGGGGGEGGEGGGGGGRYASVCGRNETNYRFFHYSYLHR